MTDKELSIVLRELACSQPTPLCEKWTEEWKDETDIDELADKFIRGFDFCVKNNYPPLDFIRKNVKKEDLHRHNIFIDEEVQIADAENGYYVFLGRCTGTLWVNGLKAVTVYVRHDSVINVEAYDGARVQVRYYDNSDGACKSDSYSRVKKIIRKS